MYTIENAIQDFRDTWPKTAARTGENRIQKACRIADKRGTIIHTPDDQVFMVRSDSNPRGKYRVHIGEKSCSCPDAGKGNVCKHRLAVWIYLRIREHSVKQIEEAHRVRKERYKAWKAANPDSPNIDYANFCHYPYHGTVKYMHPCMGEMEIEILATQIYEGLIDHLPTVDVVALRRNPFADGIFQLPHARIYAGHFTPIDAVEEPANER